MTSNPHPGSRPPPWRPRFHLATLMLAVLVCGITAATGRYLLQTLDGTGRGRFSFVIAVLLLPTVLLMLASMTRSLIVSLRSPPRR